MRRFLMASALMVPGVAWGQQNNGPRVVGPAAITSGSIDGVAVGMQAPIGRTIGRVPITYGSFETGTGYSYIIGNATARPGILGITAPSQIATYTDRDSVGVYIENDLPGDTTANVSSFTATSVTFTGTLSPAQQAQLLVGSYIDTSDTPKYTGAITAVSGNTVTVSGWFQTGNTASGQVPSGTVVHLNPVTKGWAQNSLVTLYSGSYATAAEGYEMDLVVRKPGATVWGFDAYTVPGVSLYPSTAHFISRGDTFYGYEATDAQTAGYHFNPSGSFPFGAAFLTDQPSGTGFQSNQAGGISFLAKGNVGGGSYQAQNATGATTYNVNGASGNLDLGAQSGTATTPTVAFHSSGSSTIDAAFNGVGGTPGTAGAGKIAFTASSIYVVGNNGSGNNLNLYGAPSGGGVVGVNALGPDTNIPIAIAGKGSSSVLLGTQFANYITATGGATGSSVKFGTNAATDTTVNTAFVSKGLGLLCLGALTDCGNETLRVTPTASQVNGVQVRGSVSGLATSIVPFGADTNVGLALAGKGTGATQLGSTTSAASVASALTLPVASNLTASGTSQGTALGLTTDISVFTTVAGGAGGRLQSNTGQRQEVFNRGANALLVYPPSGSQIEANAANASVSIPVGGHAVFECVTATQCYQAP